VSATWRFLSPVSDDNNSPDPTLHFATFGAEDRFNARVPSYSYFDVESTWYVGKYLMLRAGINNVADKDPPIINSTLIPGGDANTIDVYDMFGRQVFLSFTAKY
jgi:outer membrane receptor protein involved in Fe transport